MNPMFSLYKESTMSNDIKKLYNNIEQDFSNAIEAIKDKYNLKHTESHVDPSCRTSIQLRLNEADKDFYLSFHFGISDSKHAYSINKVLNESQAKKLGMEEINFRTRNSFIDLSSLEGCDSCKVKLGER